MQLLSLKQKTLGKFYSIEKMPSAAIINVIYSEFAVCCGLTTDHSLFCESSYTGNFLLKLFMDLVTLLICQSMHFHTTRELQQVGLRMSYAACNTETSQPNQRTLVSLKYQTSNLLFAYL